MSEEQEAMYNRAMDVAKQRGQDMKSIQEARDAAAMERAKLQGSVRKEIAGQLLGSKKGDKASNVAYQSLNTLLRNATTRKDALQASYTQLVKNSNDEAAQMVKAQMDSEDRNIEDLNQQMKALQYKDLFEDIWGSMLIGGGVPSGK